MIVIHRRTENDPLAAAAILDGSAEVSKELVVLDQGIDEIAKHGNGGRKMIMRTAKDAFEVKIGGQLVVGLAMSQH